MSEVPAAWSLDECEALAAAVPRSGRVYMMAENMNFFHYLTQWKKRIQSGEYAKMFIAEGACNYASLNARRRQTAEHPVEQVGAKLRAMMPWITANQLVDKSKN